MLREQKTLEELPYFWGIAQLSHVLIWRFTVYCKHRKMLTMVSAQISLTETLQQILLDKNRETSQRKCSASEQDCYYIRGGAIHRAPSVIG